MAEPDSSLTPEQRLLKLIEEQESKDAGSSQAGGEKTAVSRKVDWKALLKPVALKERAQVTQQQFVQFVKAHQSRLRLKTVNRAIRIFTVFFALLLFGIVLLDLQKVHKDYMSDLASTKSVAFDLASLETPDIATPYFDPLNVRNVFAPSERTTQAEKEVSALTLRVLQMTENLKLTGISENPENPNRTFCMIEDLEKNITFFLKEGDTIGGLVIAEIKEDSVVLKFNEEIIELR